MAFTPPVSAMKGTMAPARAASATWMRFAVSCEPVKTTPPTLASATSRAPSVAPSPITQCAAARGKPASCRISSARSATHGVCSAGLATTLLPAASAAATWPRKMASGKFQGLMQANTPRPCRESWLRSPAGPASTSGAENRRFASSA
jgi:hypothetical protein